MAIARMDELLKNPYTIDYSDTMQLMELESLEYFRRQAAQIKALQVQSTKRNVPEIPQSLQDLVPALFTHSSYKSYPERWLRDGAWAKMNGWLSRLSAIQPQCDVSTVQTLDEWLDALKTDSLCVTHSSGTTGKPSLFPRTAYEVDSFGKNIARGLTEFYPIRAGEGLPTFVGSFEDGYNVFVLGFGSMARTFGHPDHTYYLFPGKLGADQARQGAIMKYKYARGELDPTQAKQFEEQAKKQQQMMQQVFSNYVETLAKYRGQKIFFGMGPAQAFAVTAIGLKKGYEGLFSEDSVMLTGGGLKGAQLPPDYMKRIYEFTGIREDHHADLYGMTECNSVAAACPEYQNKHIQPWLQPMVLSRDGTELLNTDGKATGRWAFIDPIATNYWGGIVTGDLVTVDFSGCDCGRHGPVLVGEIKRYTDLQGVDEDKLSCMAQLNDYLMSDVGGSPSELEF
jgi:acyl-CoA synthetase (AMP-forming)/AMP-acid ligase II